MPKRQNPKFEPQIMEIEIVKIELLKPASYNPRKISTKEMEKLVASLETFGFVEPVVVNQDDTIIGGHQRVEAAKRLGLEVVPIVRVDIPKEKEQALNLALNRISGEWDNGKLAQLLAAFNDEQKRLSGFDEDEIASMLEKAMKGEDDGFEATPPAEPKTKPGEMYMLGDHVLMCGDATKAADLDRLMGGVQASLIFTDPPYGVSYVGKTKDALEIKNDKLNTENLTAFLDSAFTAAFSVLKPGGVWYVAGPAGHPYNGSFQAALADKGLHHVLVWVKHTFAMGRADYHYRHEVVFYGWKEGAPHYFIEDRTQDTVWGTEPTDEQLLTWARAELEKTDVWRFKKPARNGEHPTMKPIPLVVRAVYNSSRMGEVVLDMFGGSGTTLMACEQTGRQCRIMELDPRYCDVIIKRWEEYTGQQAERVE